MIDEIRIDHQREADDTGLPEIEFFAVGKRAPAERSKNETGEKIVWAEFHEGGFLGNFLAFEQRE